ncbi:MAG: hypothetical protein H6600_02795 [Flavobacteriales bacterium]|nr:hypothetical protein [Flavobacteriales bacterium]MCB9197358.1 hypothetical protein [Flavobacteriales bacterium]
MESLKQKIENLNIEWDGPIIIINNDEVTILSPFKIIDILIRTNKKVYEEIMDTIIRANSRKTVLQYLEHLGKLLLKVKV